MTEPTYTEAEILAGIKKVRMDKLGSLAVIEPSDLFKELKRPKHDFAEGQVAYDPINKEYFQIASMEVWGLSDCRHLNLTELGPHVKALRDAMVSISRQVHSGSILAKARSALKAFDAAVGENNDSRN